MKKLWIALALTVGAAAGIASTPRLTPIMMLPGVTDANGYLMVTNNTDSGTYTALTPIGNLPGRTDANGYLMVAGAGVTWPVTATAGGAIRTGTTAADTLLLQAYDTDTGPAYVSPITLTAGTSPTLGIWAGSAGAPAIVNQESATKQGGIYFVNDSVIISGSQSAAASFNYNAFAEFGVASGGKIGFGASTPFTLDTFFMREASATLQLGADAAGTTAYTLKSNDRITSDGVGGDLTIAAGRGYGAAGGSLYFQTAPTIASGNPGVLATRLTIAPTGTATFAGNVELSAGTLTLAANKYIYWSGRGYMGGTADGTLYVSNSADNGFTTLNLGPSTGNTANGTLSISKAFTTTNMTSGTGTVTSATTALPAGSLILGVSCRVTTVLAGTSLSTWSVGTAAGPTIWGTALAKDANTTSNIANYLAGTAPFYNISAAGIVFTAAAGQFDTGVTKCTTYYVQYINIPAV